MPEQPETPTAKLAPAYSLAFKKVAVARMELGEGATALAQELGVHRTVLYTWRKAQRAGRLAADGRKGVRPADPERKADPQRKADPDRKAVPRMRAQAEADTDSEAALQTLREIMAAEAASEASRTSAANALLNRGQNRAGQNIAAPDGAGRVELVTPTPQRRIVWLVVDPKLH